MEIHSRQRQRDAHLEKRLGYPVSRAFRLRGVPPLDEIVAGDFDNVQKGTGLSVIGPKRRQGFQVVLRQSLVCVIQMVCEEGCKQKPKS